MFYLFMLAVDAEVIIASENSFWNHEASHHQEENKVFVFIAIFLAN